MYDTLMQLPVFQGISKEQMTHILEVIPFDFRQYSAGDEICRGGDVCSGVTFLLSGSIRLETPVFRRRVRIYQTFQAPYTFSLQHLFGAEVNVRSTMTAERDRTGVMLLSKADFLKLLQSSEIALVNTMNILCTRAQKQHSLIDYSAESDPMLRLSSWILSFTERRAKDIVIEASEKEWCTMLQLDSTTFWRSVAILEGLHLIESERGRLKLLDRYGLKTLVGSKTTQK